MSASKKTLFTRFVIMVAVLSITGCQYVDLSSLSPSVEVSEPKGPKPLAILSVSPGEQSFDAGLQLLGLSDQNTPKPFEKRFPGVDIERPATALLYLSDDGHADPLFYVPVDDYEKFLIGLSKKFKLNQAIATKVTIRNQPLVVMHVGDNAVFGHSAHSIKRAPSTLQPWLEKFATNSDISFNWLGTDKKPAELKRLLATVKSSFGSSAAYILARAESVAVDISADKDKTLVEATINVDEKNSDKLKTQLTKMVPDQDSISTNNAPNAQQNFRVTLPSEASRKSFTKIQIALSDFLQTQAVLSRKRKTKRVSSEKPDKALNQFTSLLNDSSGSGSQCPPKKRRSGG